MHLYSSKQAMYDNGRRRGRTPNKNNKNATTKVAHTVKSMLKQKKSIDHEAVNRETQTYCAWCQVPVPVQKVFVRRNVRHTLSPVVPLD